MEHAYEQIKYSKCPQTSSYGNFNILPNIVPVPYQNKREREREREREKESSVLMKKGYNKKTCENIEQHATTK